MTRTIALIATLFLVMSSFAVGVSAQGTQTGTLRGIVLDQQGLPIPAVTVTITSPQLQGQRTVLTETDGTFVFRQLPAGTYDISYESTPFTSANQTTTIPLGGTVEQSVTLRAAGVAEEVQVVAETPAPIATPSVGLNIRQEEVEALPVSRTLQGIASLSPALTTNTPNGGQVTINGAFAFDNVFMLNGVDVNDNLFGSPQNLFIEDAIAETQVLTSGISAEYGRFTGGVVNAITKSGGNTFDGSYRLNLSNPTWSTRTPFEVESGIEKTDELARVHEGTFGGPILRDRIWFFTAGRLSESTISQSLPQTGLPYNQVDTNRRGEVKVTATAMNNHTFQGGYLNNYREQTDRPTFSFSIDQFTIGDRTLPNWYGFGNYRGVLRNNLLAEAQYSERRFQFKNSGGTDTNIINSPFITLTQQLGHYNARYFDATDPESRNNRQFTGSLTSFLEGYGRHEVKGGYEFFRSQRSGGNSQSATSYVFDADYATDAAGNPLFDASGYLLPVFVPGETQLENWIPVRGATLNVDNQSFYVQDHWTINRNFSADLGFRYERVRSEATGGLIGVDTDTWVPRLALAYDPYANGRFVINTSYGHYAGRYSESQVGENSNVGTPDLLLGIYNGPAGQGRDFAPGFNPANYQTVVGQFPTANISIEDGLSSPIVREFTLSAGGSLTNRGYAEVSYIWRDTGNFIEDFIEIGNGTTTIIRDGRNFGTFTNIVYRNTDVADRNYQGLVMQGRYRVRNNWFANAFWTIQLKNEGNYEGEFTNQPGSPSQIGDYPEIFDADLHFPTGRSAGASAFQRHRLGAWSVYDQGLGRYGSLTFSGVVRAESGEAYSLRATNQPLTPAQRAALTAAGYPNGPSSQTLFFGGRGNEMFEGYGVVDASINYNIPVWRDVRPWVKFDMFNVFNNLKQIESNIAISRDTTGPTNALGVWTTGRKGANFGKATSNTHFIGSQAGWDGEILYGRTFRVSMGLRF